jgi:hypothetical protein
MTRSLEALRGDDLDIIVREKGNPETAVVVAKATNQKSLDLMLNTMTLAFELMEVMPDRAAGITLQ